MKFRHLVSFLAVPTLLALSGCASDEIFRNRAKPADDLAYSQKQLEQSPDDKLAKSRQADARFRYASELVAEADGLLKKGNIKDAKEIYEQAQRLDAGNPRAKAGLLAVEREGQLRQSIADARQLLGQGQDEAALAKIRSVLIEGPDRADALQLIREIEDKAAKSQAMPKKLTTPLSPTVTLEFRDANLRNIFEVISRTSGINFVLDPNIPSDLRASVFLKDVSAVEVIDFLLMMHQLGKKVLTENSVLIYPQIRAAQYEDQHVRVFYLNYADAKQAAAMVKSLLPIRDVYVDDKLNLIGVKAPYDQLRNVERLIADTDVAEPEVVLELEVLEVNRSRFTDLGVNFPDTISLLGAGVSSASATTTGTLTWSDLKNINSDRISVAPAPFLRLLRTDADTSTLANPRIRIKNKEKARIHIGDKIPIKTSTISSTGNVVGNSASYLDVGLKLDVEPRVVLNGDVSIKLNLEVSSASQAAGADFPTVSTRNTSTVMMAGDNETQVLAGLINDEDRKSARRLPGLGDIPLLGRLFSDQSTTRSKTEIVLLITPRVVRNLVRSDARNVEFYGGTASGRSAPLNLNPAASVGQFGGAAESPARFVSPPDREPAAVGVPGGSPAEPAPSPNAPVIRLPGFSNVPAESPDRGPGR